MLLAVCEPEAVGDEEEAPFVCGAELDDMMNVGSSVEGVEGVGRCGVSWCRDGKTSTRVKTTAPGYTRIELSVDGRCVNRSYRTTLLKFVLDGSERRYCR